MSEYTQERLRSLLYRTQKKKGPLMPPPVYPVTIDDNLVFLWRAIQHSNYTKIDFNLLGNDFHLNREEALECFRELRRAIEDAVYNNYMEKSNDRRENAGPTNILGLAVRRRKEGAEAAAVEEDAEYEDDAGYYNAEYDGEEYDEEDAQDEASHAASAKGDSLAAESSRAGASKAGTSNVGSSSVASLPAGTLKTGPSKANTPNAGPSRVSIPVAGDSKTGSSSTGTSKTGHQSAGLSKQVSSASGQPACGTGPLNPGHSNTGPSNAGTSQASARSSSAEHPNASHPSAPSSNVGPSNVNISVSRVAPFDSAPSSVSLNAGHQSTGHTNADKAVNNPIIKSEAGQALESVKLAPIRAGQSLNLPLPRLTNSAGPSIAQPSNVGSLSTFPPSSIPALGAISGPQLTRSPTVPAMNYFPPSAATVSAATSLTSMMIPQAPQLSNQTSSQTENGPVVLDITSLRCFFGVVDQGVGPTSLNDKLFSRPDFFFPIRTPTFPMPYGPDASRANESQTQGPRPSLPSLSSLYAGPSMLAGQPSSPAMVDKGKKRKRVSGSGGEMEEVKSGKDKDPAE